MNPTERELRVEIDRLRSEHQRLLADREPTDPATALRRAAGDLRQAAWQRYCVMRWHVLHARDPRRALRPRDACEPYRVQPLHQPLASRPRVLHVIGNLHTGGSARLIVDLVERLGHCYEQRILVRSLPPAAAYLGLDLWHLPRLRARRVHRLLRQYRPDLVHVHMLGHQHDEYGQRDWSWYHQVFQALQDYGRPVIENVNIPVEPYISEAVSCYVYVSDVVRDQFGRLDAWNVTVHPGSDLERFCRTPEQPVTDDCIGMIYRLQPDKLNERSIEPFIRVVQKRPRTTARIVGGGQFLDLYKRRAHEAGVENAFVFTGYVPYDELPGHLAAMSAFVAPVHTESFGQVSPFAMAMSLPVVGYDVGALAEITNAPELLAPAGDVERLASILVELLDDRERRLRIGQQNRRRAEELFSVSRMAARYEELYGEVLRGGRVARSSAARRPYVAARPATCTTPTVTVLMPVYNGERYLRPAIDSILRQTFTDFELLIVDDGSVDRSCAIAESYRDRRIRIVRNGANVGLSRSLNRGVALARGRYLARLDADDIAEPTRLAAQVDYLERHPDVELLGSWCTVVNADGDVLARRYGPCVDAEIRWTLQFCTPFAHSSVMMRRPAEGAAAPLYDESLAYAMDYDLWLKLAARGRIASLNQFLVRWRISPDGMTSRLGDRTERFERVAADLARRLGWGGDERLQITRRTELLSALIAGATPDASPSETRWAVETLFTLLDDFCRRQSLEPEQTRALHATVTEHTARVVLWMAHQYPDRRDYRSALDLLWCAARLSPRALLTRNGIGVGAKLVGRRPAVAVLRLLAGRSRGSYESFVLPTNST